MMPKMLTAARCVATLWAAGVAAQGSAGALPQLASITIPDAGGPSAMAINPATNKLYVVTKEATLLTEIDERTFASVNIPLQAGDLPTLGDVKVNANTNKIYVTDAHRKLVTVIDGATHAITRVATSGVAYALAVNAWTNKVYVLEMRGRTKCMCWSRMRMRWLCWMRTGIWCRT